MDDLISKLSGIRSQYNCFDEAEEPYYRALSEAIEALSAQPEERTNKRTETHACDCISRQAAIDEISEYGSGNSVYMSVGELKRRIEQLPLAQPELPADVEFWRKRADYYSDMCLKLIADMEKGVKIEAVKIDETGITFMKKKPEPHWIPCSKGLPKKDGEYIVTDDSGGRAWVEISNFIRCDDGSIYWDYANVTAWMPKPEPYQEGGQDE